MAASHSVYQHCTFFNGSPVMLFAF
uniref:Uncharacterized protein n=1 Tax=Anguilla anguilla TaxID=7936 RepID=A0A0E9UUS5_ANGAN